MIKQMENEIQSVKSYLESVPWNTKEGYAMWLSQAYYIAKRSTSFLGLCLFHSNQYPEFQKRCTTHIGEETGHEKLLLNDIKNLGMTLQQELPTTAAVYQPQYFRIVAENPMSFMGYVFFLELLAPAYGPWVMERAGQPKAQSFLKVHTAADENHIEEASKILELMPKELRELAWSNFMMTSYTYKAMLTQIAEITSTAKAA